MSFWNLDPWISSFAPQTVCSVGDDRAEQQYGTVISLTYEWTQMESQAQSVCDLLLYDSYSVHIVQTTGRAVLATTSCSLILLWFKYIRRDGGLMSN